MLPATKRTQIASNQKENENFNAFNAESGFHSQVDFSCTTTSSSSLDVSVLRRKSCVPSFRGSYQQPSFSDSNQSPSGYGSNFEASKLAILATPGKSSRKRKTEIHETDENFYNSYQFVSPLKQRKRDPNDKNCAKLILKEKCTSENVIVSSTPVRANKWGKFRSFHPEKLQFGKSLDEEPEAIESVPVKVTHDSSSFNYSSINFSNASFNTDNNIPLENFQNLLAADIKTEPIKSVKAPIPATIIKPLNTQPRYAENKRIDILGMLNLRYDNLVLNILDYMDAESLLNISHVSQAYRNVILKNKVYETKRKVYLNHHRSIIENKYPSCGSRRISTSSSHIKKKAFGPSNLINQQSSMILRQRPVTPPQSPHKKQQQVGFHRIFL